MSTPTVAPAAGTAVTVSTGAQVVSSAAQVAAVTALVEAQAAARLRLVANATAYLLRLLSGFKGWYDEDEVLRFAAEADATVRRAQQASADLATSYQVQMLARLGVGLSRAEQLRARFVIPGPDEPNLRGLDFLTEWERPAEQYRYARSTGADHAAALEKAAQRLRSLAEADETLAMRRATQRALQVAAGLDPDAEAGADTDVSRGARPGLPGEGGRTARADEDANDLADPEFLDGRGDDELDAAAERARQEPPVRGRTGVKVIGQRRVLHPELTKSGPCGLCVVASDRWYTVRELQPMHDRCECTVAPIVVRDGKLEDPGRKVNAADLERIYEAAGGTDQDRLARTRVRVDEHGELGPVLSLASRAAKSAKQARAASRHAGESDLDQARRLRDVSAQQVTYLQGLIDGGQSKYAPTLANQKRLLKQREALVKRLSTSAA